MPQVYDTEYLSLPQQVQQNKDDIEWLKQNGIIFNPLGAWNQDTQYEKNDFVYYGTSSYLATQANLGYRPDINAQYWQPIALGLKGPKGDKGDTGAQGPQGLRGLQGEQGPQGTPGPQGLTGPQGPQGVQGVQGQKGDPGKDGTSFMVTGSVNDSADLPDAGTVDAGTAYFVGAAAPRDIYVVAENEGVKTWVNQGQLQGPKGEQGVQGIQGIQGIQGEQGPQGPAGPVGPQGEQGETGPQGPAGPQGTTGQPGPAGPQGGGFFSTTANSSTSISLSSISPTNITPLVGDTVFFANNGDIRTVQSVSGNTVTLSSVVTNLKPFFPFGSIAIQSSSNTGWYEAGRVPLLSGGGAYSGLFDITYIDLSGANPPCSGRINVTGVNDGVAWIDVYTRLYTLCGNLSNAGVAIKTVEGDDDYLRLYVLVQTGHRIEVNCVSEYYGATPSQIMNFTGTYYGSSRPSGVTLPVVTNIASGTTKSTQSMSLSENDIVQSDAEPAAMKK